MKSVLCFIAALFSALTLLAQNSSVSGRLLDENGEPVEYANIVVKAADGSALTGGVSNGNGEFSFALGEGRFTIEASCIGYQTLTITCSAGDLGELTMPKDLEQLESVTVQSQRTVQKGSQYLVVPDPKEVGVASKGIDLLALQQLPGLKVDVALQNISIDGGTPVLKINGREVQANRLINLSPSKIKRIEYTNSPGLRYLDRGATGVINIVLKEPDDGGSVYVDAGSDLQLMMSDAYTSASYHKGKSEFELEYYFSRRHYKHGPNEDSESYIAPQRVVTRESIAERPVYYMVNNLTADYTYQKNDSTMFVASLHNNLFKGDNGGSGTMKRTDRGETTVTAVETSVPTNTFEPSLDMFYSQKLANGQKLELNFVGQYSNSDAERTITYTSGGSSVSYPTIIHNSGWALSGEGVYSRQFGKVGTRWGVQYQHNYARNDYKVSKVVSEMTKDNTYIFGQADGPVGDKFNWSVGTGAKIFFVRDGDASRTYVRNLSTAQVNWRLNDCWSATGEVRFTPSLPSLSDLSPVFQRTDDVEAVQGNADLKPSETLNSRIIVRYASKNGWFINLTGGNQYTSGEIISTYRYDAATDLFVASPQNSDFHNVTYATGEVGVKGLFGFLNLNANAQYTHEKSTGTGFQHVNDNLSVNVGGQAVWKKFIVGAYFNVKPEWYLHGEILAQSERGQNIFAQYKWNNLAIHVNWHCPFNPKGYSYEYYYLSEIHPGHHINWTVDNGNMIVLGLTWNLDFGSAFNKGNKTLSNGGYDSGMVR